MSDRLPECGAGVPGICLMACHDVLPGCWANASGSAGKPVELRREDARDGWGHVGIPNLGLRDWAGCMTRNLIIVVKNFFPCSDISPDIS